MANDKSSRGVDKWGEGDDGEDWKKPFQLKKELEGLEEEEEEDQNIAPKIKSTERICGACGRFFKSGKALGGHMRVHFLKKDDKQQNNNKNNRKTNQKTIKLELKEEEEEEEIEQENEKDPAVEIPKCPLCPKTFRSLKCMYGHLRSHPNRYWRGSRPPSDEQLDGVINHDDSSSKSSSLMLSRWPVTASRGGRGNKPISENSRILIEEDEELLEGCTNLWYLSRRGNSTAHTPSSILIQRGSSSQAAAAEVAIEADHVLPISKSSSSTTTISEEDKQLKKVNFKSDNIIDIDSCDDERLITLKINSNNNKNKRKLVMDSDPRRKYKKSSSKNQVADDEEKSKCSICNKEFMTYHGLGGHMSVHTRERNINNIHQDQDQDQVQAQAQARSKRVTDIGIGIELYGCKWCKKIFSTSQAIEGHEKKCHRSTSTTTGGPLIINETREDNNVFQPNHVINLGFDLNEMPHLQEDVNERQPSSSEEDDKF